MENQDLIINTLDKIPQVNSNAKRIVGLVKEGSINTGYQLSDNSIVKKQQAMDMAKQGQIAGVDIARWSFHSGGLSLFIASPFLTGSAVGLSASALQSQPSLPQSSPPVSSHCSLVLAQTCGRFASIGTHWRAFTLPEVYIDLANAARSPFAMPGLICS